MAALATERDTIRYGKEPLPATYAHKMAAGVKAYAGGLAVIDNTGYCRPGRGVATDRAIGRFEETVDNTGGAAGALLVHVLSGEFKWATAGGGDTVTQAFVGRPAYVVDDQTVAATDNTGARSFAGIVTRVETDGIWVLMGLAIRP